MHSTGNLRRFISRRSAVTESLLRLRGRVRVRVRARVRVRVRVRA